MDFSLQNLIYKSLIEEILKSRSRDNHDITINSFDMNSNKAFWNITCMYQQTLICLFYVTRHRVIWINITVWNKHVVGCVATSFVIWCWLIELIRMQAILSCYRCNGEIVQLLGILPLLKTFVQTPALFLVSEFNYLESNYPILRQSFVCLLLFCICMVWTLR